MGASLMSKLFKSKKTEHEQQETEQPHDLPHPKPRSSHLRIPSAIKTLGKRTKIVTIAARRLHVTKETKECRETRTALRYWAYLDNDPPQQADHQEPYYGQPCYGQATAAPSIHDNESELSSGAVIGPEIIAQLPVSAVPGHASCTSSEPAEVLPSSESKAGAGAELLTNHVRYESKAESPKQTLGFSMPISQSIIPSTLPSKSVEASPAAKPQPVSATQEGNTKAPVEAVSVGNQRELLAQQKPLPPLPGSAEREHSVLRRPASVHSQVTANSDKGNSRPSNVLPSPAQTGDCHPWVHHALTAALVVETGSPWVPPTVPANDMNDCSHYTLGTGSLDSEIIHELGKSSIQEEHSQYASQRHDIDEATMGRADSTPGHTASSYHAHDLYRIEKHYGSTDAGSPILLSSRVRRRVQVNNNVPVRDSDVSVLDLSREANTHIQETKAFGLVPSTSMPIASDHFFNESNVPPVVAKALQPSTSTNAASTTNTSGTWSTGIAGGSVTDPQATQTHLAQLNDLYRSAVNENVHLLHKIDDLEATITYLTRSRDDSLAQAEHADNLLSDAKDLNASINEECARMQGKVLSMHYRDHLALTLLAASGRDALAKVVRGREDRATGTQLERGDGFLTTSNLRTELDCAMKEIERLEGELRLWRWDMPQPSVGDGRKGEGDGTRKGGGGR